MKANDIKANFENLFGYISRQNMIEENISIQNFKKKSKADIGKMTDKEKIDLLISIVKLMLNEKYE